LEFAIIDLETTGAPANGGKITEIAIVISDGKQILHKYETLLNPEREIPFFVARLTGITDDMVVESPRFFEVAKEVLELTKGRVFVAHNIGFDYGFMKQEFKALGFEYKRDTICTVKTSRKVFPGLESYSLGKIAKHFNIPINGRHRAMGDAEATAHLFHKMIAKDPSFIQDIKYENYLSDHLKIDKIPNEPGVYYFLDKKGKIIYIGKSKRLKSRVRTHLNNFKTKKGLAIIEEIDKVRILKTEFDTMALLYENMEIKNHKPIYNRAQKNTIFPFGLFLDNETDNYHKIFIDKVTSTNSPIVGYKSRREAKDALIKITEQYKFCSKINELEKTDKNKSCFGYQIKNCNGACIEKEDSQEYNKRIISFCANMGITEKSYIFISPPLKRGKRAFVVVQKGIINGFGYGQKNTNFNNIDQLILLSESFNPDKDFQRVLKHLIADENFTKKRI
jgi:DNA polymerase-3 subunit epsilon